MFGQQTMNTNRKQTRAQPSSSMSNSGGSLPVIISCSMSATLPQSTVLGLSRGTVQASNRSATSSLSYVISHARTKNLNLLTRINIPMPGRPIRTSSTIPSLIRQQEPKDKPEEIQQFIMLNSPKEPAVEISMD
jgi:hypothetical protein